MKSECAAIVLLATLAFGGTRALAQDQIAFDWFEYEGRDPVFEEPLRPGHYRNPVLAGFYPDPSVVRVGEDYYLVTSSFAYFPGLPVFHSRDLVNWRQIGHALDRRSQLTFETGQGISRGIFAPTIRYHDGVFYIITTDVDGIGNFYITARDPAGPWSDPVLLPEIRGIDPDLFFDEDGRVYIAHNGEPEGEPRYPGHRAIWLWQFDPEQQQVVADSGRIVVDGGVDPASQPIWIEAPHLYRVGGWYYLSCAEGGTAEQHSQVVFRSRRLDQPFVPWERNPILTQRDLDPKRRNPISSTGHADLVQTPGGDWWAVFLGVRPYPGGFHNTGRETFLLPVRWQDEWPLILDPGTAVPWQEKLPRGLSANTPAPPQSGNFIWRDEFEQPNLALNWVRVRTSAAQWLSHDPAAGQIRLQALPTSLAARTQPAFLARRQQHAEFAASTSMQLPQAAGLAAGLAAFQSSDHHYFLAARRDGDAYRIALEAVRGGARTFLAEERFETVADWVILGLEQQGALLNFYYSAEPGRRTWLARDIDATLLSTQVAGGFVGATLGMHVRRE